MLERLIAAIRQNPKGVFIFLMASLVYGLATGAGIWEIMQNPAKMEVGMQVLLGVVLPLSLAIAIPTMAYLGSRAWQYCRNSETTEGETESLVSQNQPQNIYVNIARLSQNVSHSSQFQQITVQPTSEFQQRGDAPPPRKELKTDEKLSRDALIKARDTSPKVEPTSTTVDPKDITQDTNPTSQTFK